MIRSSPKSFLLILMFSILLPSVGRSAALTPSPRPTAPPSQSANLRDQQAEKHVAPIIDPNIASTINGDAATADKEKGGDGASLAVIIATIVSAVATAFMAWFNFQLVSVTHGMKEITEKATKAERPYLIIKDLKLHNLRTRSRKFKRQVEGSFVLYNHGKGAAIAPSVWARFEVVEAFVIRGPTDPIPPPEQKRPIRGESTRCEDLASHDQAIAPQSSSATYWMVLGNVDEFGQLINPKLAYLSDEILEELLVELDIYEHTGPKISIVAHIGFEYRDIAGDKWSDESIWYYSPSRDPAEEGAFWLAPPHF